MLYGDDDTQFFLSGAMRLLAHLDPSQPLALTDHIWFADRRHDADAPKCLPCSFNTSFLRAAHGEDGAFHPRPACPFCTVDLACARYGPQHRCGPAHDATFRAAYSPRLQGRPNGGPGREEDVELFNSHYAVWFSSQRNAEDAARSEAEGADSVEQPDESEGARGQAGAGRTGRGSAAESSGGLEAFEAAAHDERVWEAAASLPFPFCARHDDRVHSRKPPAGCLGSSFYGGSGLVVSVGLMRALDLAAAERLIRGLRNATGGDYMLSRALEAQGFGLTDPGLHHLHDGGSRHYRQFGGHRRTLMDSLEAFALCSEPLQNPEVLPEERLWLLEHAVAQHARASHTEGAAELMARRAETHMALHTIAARLQRDPRVRAGRLALWEGLRQDVCAKGAAAQPGRDQDQKQEEEQKEGLG
ncbi:hypothetical protein HYH03_006554 [Edaphochlamys debaryana]|uniref:Uncharacterized protein n=1 Tax=Edaphochlamys debaryana TaxID=47281 RepID=A0A836C000_9CHLO|nr:hypothetical protein HYH03_006554 [Edaphochlamys debaryana]|eukprot:KAG2495281.1 hypothetical protein HYH03_006554 [Edaphochlamys debaryana]